MTPFAPPHLDVASARLLAALLPPPMPSSTMVRLHTTQGPIDLQLYDVDTPKTVANFLGYVRRGDYADTFVHRSSSSSRPVDMRFVVGLHRPYPGRNHP